tara:strand:- start:208 stop:1482 length:1275 start_codon:yes stop_codon:yes gene_type:complete
MTWGEAHEATRKLLGRGCYSCDDLALGCDWLLSAHKKNNFRQVEYLRVSELIYHMILAIISICTLVKLRMTGIKIGHFFVAVDFQKDAYGFRSFHIREQISPDETANILYSLSPLDSLKKILLRRNQVYIRSLEVAYLLVTSPASFSRQSNSESDWFKGKLKSLKKIKKLNRYILKILNIKKMIFLDHTKRIAPMALACRDAGVERLAYMHGGFGHFRPGLGHLKFDRYLVWSDFFADKLVEYRVQERNSIIIGGRNLKPSGGDRAMSKKGKNCLILVDVNEGWEYLGSHTETLRCNGWTLFLRGKPGIGVKRPKEGLFNEDDNTVPLLDSLINNQISVMVSMGSLALYESWSVNVPSLFVLSGDDWHIDIVEDGLLPSCRADGDISKEINVLYEMPESEIAVVRQKIWDGQHSNWPAAWLGKG